MEGKLRREGTEKGEMCTNVNKLGSEVDGEKSKILFVMSEQKKVRKNWCQGKSGDTNLKSSRHSTCLKEWVGWSEVEEDKDEGGGKSTDKKSRAYLVM